MAWNSSGGPRRDPLGRYAFRLLLSAGAFTAFLTVVVIIDSLRGGTGSADSTAAIFPAALLTFAFCLVPFVVWRARRSGPPSDAPEAPTTAGAIAPADSRWAGLRPPPAHRPPITYDGSLRRGSGFFRRGWPGQLIVDEDELVLGDSRSVLRAGRNRVREVHLSPLGVVSIHYVDEKQANVQFVQLRLFEAQIDLAEALQNRGWPVVDERVPIARP